MAPFQILMRQHYFKMSIELPATFIHRYSDMTEKLLKVVLTLHTNTHAHTLLPFSFIQKTGHKFARISFDTVPHKSHAINIDFSIAFWYLYVLSVFWLLSGISVLSGLYMHRVDITKIKCSKLLDEVCALHLLPSIV